MRCGSGAAGRCDNGSDEEGGFLSGNTIPSRVWRCGLWAWACAFALALSGCGGGGTGFGTAPPGPPGSLDAGFGAGGTVITSIGGHAQVNAVTLQPDGKILAAGYGSVAGGPRQVLLVRYATDGTPDAGFGAGGKILSAPYAGDAEAIGVALQPDGKIVVLAAGSSRALVRYTKEGTLDSTFGSGGVVVSEPATDTKWAAVAVQPDGKIVVAESHATTNQIGAARFNIDGTPDSSFGVGGEAVVLLPPTSGGSTSVAPSIAIQPDGKILVGGSQATAIFGGILHYSTVVRFDVNGVLDPTFGANGHDKGTLEYGLATIVLQPDGKILAEVVGSGVEPVPRVSRLLPDGTIDPAFGVGGTASGIGGLLAVQPNGKIVTAENINVGSAPSLRAGVKLSRYDTNGVLDRSFGNGGTVVQLIEANNAAGGLLIQPDGRIVVAGYESANPDPAFPLSAVVNVALVRYFGDPVATSVP